MAEDKVQVPSLRKDGTPDQTENFEIIGDKETAVAAISEQLAQKKISEADETRAAEQAAANSAEAQLSPEEQARKDEYDALADEAQSEAEALVEARWVDPASRQTDTEETTTRRSRRRSANSDEG